MNIRGLCHDWDSKRLFLIEGRKVGRQEGGRDRRQEGRKEGGWEGRKEESRKIKTAKCLLVWLLEVTGNWPK
jgi:hypothetical protein